MFRYYEFLQILSNTIMIGLWILLAGFPVLLKRQQRPSVGLYFLAPILGAIAAYAALFHIGQGS